MYVPKHFAVDDLEELHAFMARHAFAALVTVRDDAPVATHLPVLVERGAPYGTIRGHVARGNPQWRELGESEALVIFAGPHCYVTPSWYAQTDAVPTWNYTAVHAYGTPRIIEDLAVSRTLLEALVAEHEAKFARPWTMNAPSESYIEGMMRGIVAFEMPIARLEGKYKLSQNRPEEDRIAVATALAASADPGDRAVAGMMAARASSSG